MGWAAGVPPAVYRGGFLARPPFASAHATCGRQGSSLLRMDAGDNSMGERVQQSRSQGATSKTRKDTLASQLQFVTAGMPYVPTIYNWTALGLGVEGEPSQSLRLLAPRVLASLDARSAAPQRDSDSEQRLMHELENLRSEHSDINEISDRLGLQEMGGAGNVHVVAQRAALKKRKLMLKDQMVGLSAKLAKLRPAEPQLPSIAVPLSEYSEDSHDSEEEGEDDERQTESQLEVDKLMTRLNALGLRPNSVRAPACFPTCGYYWCGRGGIDHNHISALQFRISTSITYTD